MPSIRILLLEDSPLDVDQIWSRLVKGGLEFELDRVETRDAFFEALETRPYDLILADYSLLSFDGLSALAIVHERWPHTPFLFVSGGLGEEIAIESLKQGATDYVLKRRLERLVPAVTRALAKAKERTERKRAEAALRESEERHRLILESIQDYAIIYLDIEGRVARWNSGAERVLGYSEAEVLGRSLTTIFTPEDAEAGVAEAELGTAAVLGRADDERWLVCKGGERFWASGVVRPLLDEAGQLHGFVKVVHDMTERKRAEEALREADRRKDEFLAMLAHELRNPLSTIHNAIELARHSAQPERLEWAKDVISHQVKHLARLIDDLLDVSRISRGKIQLRRESVDPAAVVRSAVAAVPPLVEARRHALTVNIAPAEARVEADATRLEQILVNLLTNAAKYTREGGRIEVVARPEGSDYAVSVRDNGVGIAPEMLPRIFEPFIQVEQTIDRSLGGLGIGLTLARKLAEMHDGTLTAASAGPGQGSEFTVRLPLSRPAAPSRVGADSSANGTSAPRAPRVLIVDDNVESARGLAKCLKMLGHEVKTVFDGRSALDAARHHRSEVVLLDIGLPGLDGYQLAGLIRQDEHLKDAVLIAITGYGQETDRRRSLEAGFDHHLIKPIDFDALLPLLDRLLDRAERSSSADTFRTIHDKLAAHVESEYEAFRERTRDADDEAFDQIVPLELD
jgi:PAS domain S-box-containing protein